MVSPPKSEGRRSRGAVAGATLDLADVIEIYTGNAARATGLDVLTGTIEAGKSADLIILDRNLFEIPSDDSPTPGCFRHISRAELVFERDSMMTERPFRHPSPSSPAFSAAARPRC